MHIQWGTFISICSYMFIKWTVHTEYVTAILESIFQCKYYLRVLIYLWLFCQRGRTFAPKALPCICHYMNARCIINVHCACALFLHWPVFLHYIAKVQGGGATWGLEGAKPTCHPSNMPIYEPRWMHVRSVPWPIWPRPIMCTNMILSIIGLWKH